MIRLLTAILLSFVLGLASVSMAIARAQSPGLLVVTLCADGDTTTVTLDAEGNPVPLSHHHCPDCLVGLTLGTLPSAPQTLRPATRSERMALAAAPQAANAVILAPQARGPPSLI